MTSRNHRLFVPNHMKSQGEGVQFWVQCSPRTGRTTRVGHLQPVTRSTPIGTMDGSGLLWLLEIEVLAVDGMSGLPRSIVVNTWNPVGRAGTVPSEVVHGGRKVAIQRPRVRSAAGGR